MLNSASGFQRRRGDFDRDDRFRRFNRFRDFDRDDRFGRFNRFRDFDRDDRFRRFNRFNEFVFVDSFGFPFWAGVGAGATRTAITAAMATATHTDTADTVIRAMAMDLRLCSCSAGWLGRATTMVLLMESWTGHATRAARIRTDPQSAPVRHDRPLLVSGDDRSRLILRSMFDLSVG